MIIPGLLEQAVDHITTHPETWRQESWFCDTTACLAGHICLIAGAVPSPTRAEFGALNSIVEYEGDKISAPELAAHLTGLNRFEATWLWSADRSLDQLRTTAHRIALDLAPTWWLPGYDHGTGPVWSDPADGPVLGVHRRTVHIYVAGWWERRDHPTRALALDWATERATRSNLSMTYNPAPEGQPA